MASSVVSPSVTVGSSLPESVTSVPASGDSVITWMLQSLLPRTSERGCLSATVCRASLETGGQNP